MKIALLGYGKMGHEIEQQALAAGHSIVLKVDETNAKTYTVEELKKASVAIEFSTPQSAFDNIKKCFAANVPVVVGTTGWLEHLDEAKKICTEQNQAMLWASNFSIGVNIFFEINKRLAQLMNKYTNYEVVMEEIHHTQKLDAPSGTAITLAKDILSRIDRKENWVSTLNDLDKKNFDKSELLIQSVRKESVPGTHKIRYENDVDSIEIIHTAHNRKGFAAGALIAAEWLVGKKGVYEMSDLMKF